MSVPSRAVVATVLASLLVAAAPVSRLAYPPTRAEPKIDTYFSTKVADPFQWLEDGRSPEVIAWSAAQTDLATKYLVAQPHFATIRARVAELTHTSTSRYGLSIRKNVLFYLRETPPQAHAQLVVRDGFAGDERVLFDPAISGSANAQPSIDAYRPSNDGSKVEIETDVAGAEDESIRIVDVAGGKVLETLDHAGGGTSPVAFAWDADGNGYTHTQWPRNADDTYASSGIEIFHHTIGSDPSTDAYVFGRGRSAKSEYVLYASTDGSASAIQQSDGDGVASSLYLRSGDGRFEPVAGPTAGIGSSSLRAGAFVGDAFYAIARGRKPRGEIVAFGPGDTFATAKTIVPASAVVPQKIVPVPGGFVSVDVDGGDGAARAFDASGRLLQQVPVPAVSSIDEFAADPAGGPIVAGYENYTTREKWLAYDARTDALGETGIADLGPGDFSNVVTERVMVPALDGTVTIPLEITHARGIPRDGSAPAILTAYGAYGSVSSPYFDPQMLAWYERGDIFAQAMVRGGGEYGEGWHTAAKLATKTVSSDDLAACARWLAKNGYSDSQHLGIEGSSAGGFLMGLAVSRDPNLYRAVLGHVGIYDLLRYERTPNGYYNTGELGTVRDPAQFAWMLKQSPYHNLHPDIAYPAVLLTTGENDPRVDPYMSRKMIAVLQATSSINPMLLIQSPGQGHGLDDSFAEIVDRATIELTFFDSQLR